MNPKVLFDASLGRLVQVAGDPYSWLRKWKATSERRVAGCLPMYVPEEIVHAAGVLPVVLASSVGTTPLADSRMPTFACSLVRSNLELALRGALDSLDGIIFPYLCDATQSLHEIWKTACPGPFVHHVVLPSRLETPAARTYLLEELRRFRAALEGWTSREISDRAVWDSIDLYNANRWLLQRLYASRRTSPGLLNGREMMAAVMAGFVMPKEDHNQLLGQLLDAMEQRRHDTAGKLRIVVSGLLAPNPGVLDLIEQAGGVIVDDDLFNGARYFAGHAPHAPGPLESLASRFLNMMPCTTKHNPESGWANHVVGMARGAQADGVIFLLMKYCDTLAFDYPALQDGLDRAGIRHLLVETDQDVSGMAQLHTRIEAFLEMIRSP